MLRTSVYLELGGFEALRMQIVEDMTLARRVKQLGVRQRIAFGLGMLTLHWADGAMGVVNGMTKNLFAFFAFRPAALLAASGRDDASLAGPVRGIGISGDTSACGSDPGGNRSALWTNPSHEQSPGVDCAGFSV